MTTVHIKKKDTNETNSDLKLILECLVDLLPKTNKNKVKATERLAELELIQNDNK